MAMDDPQIERYARHIILREVGGLGQERLLASRVLVVGAGGLGSPLITYLAAAGVGAIGIVDDDRVSLSNLQRQILHGTADVDRPKVESAIDAVERINPDVGIEPHAHRLDAQNVMELIAGYDLVADGSDNFDTRFLLNDACHLGGKTLVSAAVLRFDGQLSTYMSHLGGEHPCYRCRLSRNPPPADLMPSCAEGGVLGAVAGVMGGLQATEVIKELLDIGESMSGRLLIYDALRSEFRNVPRSPRQPVPALWRQSDDPRRRSRWPPESEASGALALVIHSDDFLPRVLRPRHGQRRRRARAAGDPLLHHGRDAGPRRHRRPGRARLARASGRPSGTATANSPPPVPATSRPCWRLAASSMSASWSARAGLKAMGLARGDLRADVQLEEGGLATLLLEAGDQARIVFV